MIGPFHLAATATTEFEQGDRLVRYRASFPRGATAVRVYTATAPCVVGRPVESDAHLSAVLTPEQPEAVVATTPGWLRSLLAVWIGADGRPLERGLALVDA